MRQERIHKRAAVRRSDESTDPPEATSAEAREATRQRAQRSEYAAAIAHELDKILHDIDGALGLA